MKVTSLQIKDFCALSEAQIELDGSVTLIGGDNGAGKTTVFRALLAALGGKRAIPPDPVRHGAEGPAEVTVVCDDGYQINAKISADGDYKIKVSAGKMTTSSPAAWLRERFGELDASAFLGMEPAKQAEKIRAVAGVDTRDLDARHKAEFEFRRDIGREGERLASYAAELPEGEPGDIGSLEEELREADRLARAAVDSAAAVARWEQSAAHLDAALAAPEPPRGAEIEPLVIRARELERKLAEAKEALEAQYKINDAWDVWRENQGRATVGKANLGPRPEAITPPDSAEIRARLQAAREADAKAKAQAAAQKLREQYAAKTESLRAIAAEKQAKLKAAAWPVEGLGFDDQGRLTYQGALFEQCSQAERLRVSLAVMAHGGAPLLFLTEGSLLDKRSLAAVRETADALGVQVIVERVGDGDPGAVIIEGGRVRA
jgi:DNA repair exonuclease SbcCD ATPase subunit